MSPDPDLVHYVCIAKGTTVLAEFSRSDSAALSATAVKWLESTPPHHAHFTHTVRSKTYTYLMDGPFVCFAIFDAKLAKSEGLGLLKDIKDAVLITGERKLENLTPNCLQEDANPVFQRLLSTELRFKGDDNGGMGVKMKKKKKSSWKKQVWVVVWIELMICVVLFGVWVWVW